MIHISKIDSKIITNIIHKYIQNCEIRVFGSRITEKFKPYSDLDLAIVSQEEIDWITIEKIKEECQESMLPYRIDVLNWNTISKEFKEIILKKYEVL